MNGILANFHFLRPWWLLALAALPLLWLALTRRGADPGAWRAAVDAHLLEHVLVSAAADAPARMPRRLVVVTWSLACLALAGPAWEQLPQTLYQNRAARVFALELGPSMAAQDIKPSRYERARYKIADLLRRSGDMQVALIAYAGDAFVVAPLTDDANTVANLLDALDPSVMPAPGNDTGRAIDLGAKLIRQAGLDGGELVLLADAASEDAVAAARRARAAGVRVSVLGVGSAQGAPVALAQGGFLKNAAGNIVLPKLDASSLASLAEAGAGQYMTVGSDAADLDALLAAPAAQSMAQAKATALTTTRFRDRGPWLLLALLPLAALGFRRGWLMLVPLVLLAHAPNAAAFSWRDLWQSSDAQARAALDAGDAKQAQTLAHDPQLRGAAAYRAGDFPAAAQDFAQRADAESAYNRGNALAKQKQYREAISAYDEALQHTPDMADALANKRAVEDWLKKQSEQQKQQQQDQQQQGQQQQNQQQQDQQQQDQQQQDQQQQDQQQQDQQQQDQQQQNGSSGDQSEQDQQHPQSNSAQDGQQSKEQSAQGQQAKDTDAKAEQEKASQARREAEQKYRENMDRELQQQHDADKRREPKPVRLGAREDNAAQDEHAQAVEQWLQRVPDDPGGLLRRKFQLEYQMHQRGGGKPGDGG